MLYPKIGIRPVIDGRWGGIREGLENQTMTMAQNAKKLIEETLRCAPEGLPCHRVVHADGSTSTAFRVGGKDWQRLLLMEEGVPFLPDGRVDLANCQTCGR